MLFFLGGVQDIMAFLDGTVLSTCKMNDTKFKRRIPHSESMDNTMSGSEMCFHL